MPDAGRPGRGSYGLAPVEDRLRHLSSMNARPGEPREPDEPREPTPAPARPLGDARRTALVRLAAMVALGASSASYESVIREGFGREPQPELVLGTLVAVAPVVGLARLVAAAPGLALALGYDLEAALEQVQPGPGVACDGRELVARAVGRRPGP